MIDLHTHSNASDGEFSPSELVDLAAEKGITTLSLTDHDTLSGQNEAKKRAEKAGIRFLTGVETEVEFSPGEFHLLGYGMKLFPDGPLEKFLEEIRKRRNHRNEEMISRMQAHGFSITLENLNNLAGGEVVGRMHFAQWLINADMAENVPKAFQKWLGPERPFHVPKKRPKLEEALSAIKAVGGKTVVAHPLSLWISWGRMAKYLPEWKEMGLDGIEALHSGASKRKAERFTKLAEETGLFITGGSDFHGNGRPDRRLGYGAGGMKLDESLLRPFNEA